MMKYLPAVLNAVLCTSLVQADSCLGELAL